MNDLVDLNLLIAILNRRHPSSPKALAWLDGKSRTGSILICRVVQMGALRLMTQASVMGGDRKNASEFWGVWDRLLADERFVLAGEPAELEEAWRTICAEFPENKVAETDAYLAAFALAGGHTLATFDRGFARYESLITDILVQ